MTSKSTISKASNAAKMTKMPQGSKVSENPEIRNLFKKDMGIKINDYREPHFTNMLNLYQDLPCRWQEGQRQASDLWQRFEKSLESYESAEQYLEFRDTLKSTIIDQMRSTKAYELLCQEAPCKKEVEKDCYQPENIGRKMVLIDLIKSNFNAISYYDQSIKRKYKLKKNKDLILGGITSYKEFLSQYTSCEHIHDCKLFRQEIFKAIEPFKILKYQKMMLNKEFSKLGINDIISTKTDEIIIDRPKDLSIFDDLDYNVVRVELFTLRQIIVDENPKNFTYYLRDATEYYSPSHLSATHRKTAMNHHIFNISYVKSSIYPQIYRQVVPKLYGDEEIMVPDKSDRRSNAEGHPCMVDKIKVLSF